jgi:Ca-activated chloride channel family protein
VIKWAQPIYLWFLLTIPLGLAALVIKRVTGSRRLARAVDPELVPRLTPSLSGGLVTLKSMLLLAALAFLLLAAARPKWGERLQMYKGRGIDVVIALDASKSMFAEDVKPSRLVRAKTELSSLIDGLAGNAVGIVAFAGEAYVMCPLTTDADASKLFLDIIDPNAMPVPGTDFGKAIDVSLSVFNPKEAASAALIFVTDGDDLGKNTAQAIQRAVEARARIFPVAFATPDGAPVPDYDQGGTLTAYKKDKDGQVVMSRMNERELIVMAQATGGRFLRVEGFSSERILGELDKLRKKELGGGEFTDYVERYQLFLLIGFILLVAGLSLSNRKGKWYRSGRSQKAEGRAQNAEVQTPTIGLVIAAICVLASSAQADVGGLMRRGNGLYERGKYDEALSSYQMAEALEPDATAIRYNLGNTLYRLGRYEESMRELELVMIDKKPARRSAALYNLGNVTFKAGRLDQAIKAYTGALLISPGDKQAKQNLEFCLKKKEEQKQQQQDKQNQQQQQQDQQQQQQQPQQGMSKDQAQRVVQAVENKEKEQQKKQQQAGGRRKVEQDW